MYKSIFKPLLDSFIALIAILILLPLWILAAIVIKADSKGPVFFIQKRLGKNQAPFKLIKFRTMSHQQRSYVGQTYRDDPSITKVGKVLRRYKIDELPQLINVLRGDMAIVGPRPCLRETCDRFGNHNTIHRFKVKPGLTSPAGVNGSIYLSWAEKWWYDKWYVDHVSFHIDINTILKTILVVFLGEKRFLNKPK